MQNVHLNITKNAKKKTKKIYKQTKLNGCEKKMKVTIEYTTIEYESGNWTGTN